MDIDKGLHNTVNFTETQYKVFTLDKVEGNKRNAEEISGQCWPPINGPIVLEDANAMLHDIWADDTIVVEPGKKFYVTRGTAQLTVENINMDTDGCDGYIRFTGNTLWDFLYRLIEGCAQWHEYGQIRYRDPNVITVLTASGAQLPSYQDACDQMDWEFDGPPVASGPPAYQYIGHLPGKWTHDEL